MPEQSILLQTMDEHKPIPSPLDVAVGVILDQSGKTLLAQRPLGKSYGGWWEFPGGKVESGETIEQALSREIQEEIGIRLVQMSPWLIRLHRYPHASVRLHFWRIQAWQGTAHGNEGQGICWIDPLDYPKELVETILPASLPVLRYLQLPEQYAITQADELGERVFLDRLELALSSGLRLVQLREPSLSVKKAETLLHRMLPIIERYQAKLLVNSVHPEAWWSIAHGVHLRSVDLQDTERLNQWRSRVNPFEQLLVGASVHDAHELKQAGLLNVDFCVLSPVLATPSHPQQPTLSWEGFARIQANTTLPLYALGGLNPNHLLTARQHGAHGIAMMRGAWSANPAIA